MPPRDYETSPVSDSLDLQSVIRGLSQDLADMRAKKISPQDGLARAAVAKQLFNGVRLYLQAMQTLERKARHVDDVSPLAQTFIDGSTKGPNS